MKFKTTAKAIRNSYGEKLSISYCGAQFLLKNHAPVAYTCGTYGWNFDVYVVDGVTICTGYRGMVGKSVDYEMLSEHEKKARAIAERFCGSDEAYKENCEEIENLLHEFIQKSI